MGNRLRLISECHGDGKGICWGSSDLNIKWAQISGKVVLFIWLAPKWLTQALLIRRLIPSWIYSWREKLPSPYQSINQPKRLSRTKSTSVLIKQSQRPPLPYTILERWCQTSSYPISLLFQSLFRAQYCRSRPDAVGPQCAGHLHEYRLGAYLYGDICKFLLT